MNKFICRFCLTVLSLFTYNLLIGQNFIKKEISGSNHFAVLSDDTKPIGSLVNEAALIKKLTIEMDYFNCIY